MKKTIQKNILLAGAALLALPAAAMASGGIVGVCSDCHTMHNSEQGLPVAVTGIGGVASNTLHDGPIQNLLRMDCIACHAQDPAGTKIALTGMSNIPQVYHGDGTGDLAGGNFKYVEDLGDRRGHNVIDLFGETGRDALNGGNAPGDIRHMGQGHNFTALTCAGAKGCHGTRSQATDAYPNVNYDPGQPISATNSVNITVERKGISAITGAHHRNVDGAKDPAQITVGQGAIHSGAHVASSYRFLRGLKGYGNVAARWQNTEDNGHNEYYGSIVDIPTTDGCNRCHVEGDGSTGRSNRFSQDSTLKIPNQSMSGLCSTCHGKFHSSGGSDFAVNGSSGAFLRHPSDYVIPNKTEYAAYRNYDITAPVARQSVYSASSNTVTPGTDLVMCLSCHQAHATEYAGMLRFDYNSMTAAIAAGGFGSIAAAQAEGGCLACHTTKGVLPANR
jgi:hypothetical protein